MNDNLVNIHTWRKLMPNAGDESSNFLEFCIFTWVQSTANKKNPFMFTALATSIGTLNDIRLIDMHYTVCEISL